MLRKVLHFKLELLLQTTATMTVVVFITAGSGFIGGVGGGCSSRCIGLQIYATGKWALYKFSLKLLVL
jgi:hypothetical protein